MALLAITQFSTLMMFAVLLLGLAIVVAGIGLSHNKTGATVPAGELGASALLLFFALALWLWPILYVGAWGLWIGDNEHWFYGATPYFAVTIAIAYASWFIVCVRRRQATQAFLRLHQWGAAALLMIFGVALLSEFVEPILATDPKTAAEQIVRRWGASVALQEAPVDPEIRKDLDCHTYIAMGKREPRGRITVCRYAHFWWRASKSERFEPSQRVLTRAKKRLGQKHDNEDIGLRLLRKIVRVYPGTEAADEAERILSGSGI